ncbi:MAG TPA: hypothetical protein VHB68_04245 [Steroidobacteraceae bacterium]|nr:hypothetical protein [Steroidobacteraceae bacterium]
MLRSLVTGVCSLISVAACASTPPSHPAPTANAAVPGCVSTASRLPPRNSCTAPGQTYSQQELQQTGKINAADALRMLDPIVVAR